MENRKPCEGCPFVGKTFSQKVEAVEPPYEDDVVMLCHESVSLDGNLPDRKCVGFHEGWDEL